ESYCPLPFEARTHERNPQPEPLEEMVRAINQSSDTGFAQAVGAYLDLRLALTYLAVETFLSEFDGLAGHWGLNNFYLYRFNGGVLSQFIPWDKDNTFHELEHSIFLRTGENVLFRRALAVPELRAHYLAALERCAELAGGEGGWLERQVAAEYMLTRAAAVSDPRSPHSAEAFEGDSARLVDFARRRAGFVLAEVARARQ
ncbi:MAG: CotH kinase family protein, partial [Bryobacteraceae bacterium]